MRRVATLTLWTALAAMSWVGGSQACGVETPSPDLRQAARAQAVLSDSAVPRGPSWHLAIGGHVWFERGAAMAPSPISLARPLVAADRVWRT